MAFFQNPFATEFQGYWLLGDRHSSPTFALPPNLARSPYSIVSWVPGAYDLSGNDADGNPKNLLSIRLSIRNEPIWATIRVDVSAGAADITQCSPVEIRDVLNANEQFRSHFNCSLDAFRNGEQRLVITARNVESQIRFFALNGGAETAIGFNRRSPIGELPSYFSRHLVQGSYVGEQNIEQALVSLEPENSQVDRDVILLSEDENGRSRNIDPDAVRADWEILGGDQESSCLQKEQVGMRSTLNRPRLSTPPVRRLATWP